jgi:hypothetical protein
MITIYRLKLDKQMTGEGIEPTHGVFRSPEWWQHIKEGTLPVLKVKGTISKINNDRDWPTLRFRTEDGAELSFSQYANNPDFGDFYTIGRHIEIDYVIQRLRASDLTADFGPLTIEVPIEVRVGED